MRLFVSQLLKRTPEVRGQNRWAPGQKGLLLPNKSIKGRLEWDESVESG